MRKVKIMDNITVKPQLISSGSKSSYTAFYSRPSIFEPHEYMTTWIKDNIGYVGAASVAVPNAISILRRFNDVNAISMCFDGAWSRRDEGFIFITDALPVVACCKDSSVDIINLNDNSIYTIEGTYSGVCMIRGWKSLIDTEDMQLMLFLYTNNMVDIFVRTESNQYYKKSSLEVQDSITNISVNYLADYRVCLNITHGSKTDMYITERLYIGGAAKPGTIQLIPVNYGTATSIRLEGVVKTFVDSNSEFVTIPDFNSDGIIASNYLIKTPNNNDIFAYNKGDNIVILQIPTDFVINDPSGVRLYAGALPIPIVNITKDRFKIILECAKFNNYSGDFTVRYSDEALKLVNSSNIAGNNITFSPKGLIKDNIEPPTLVKAINMEVK